MAEENPLRQVQELLADPSNLLDRISRIRSIIGSVEATEAPQQSIQDKKEIPSREVEDLLRMLRDMQMQIDQHVRPLALQAIHIEAERLRELAKQEQVAHDRCLILLDQSLRVCIERIDEPTAMLRSQSRTYATKSGLGFFPDKACISRAFHRVEKKWA